MNDDRLLTEALRALPQPPPTPRERMWAQIAAARATTGRPLPSTRRAGAWRWAGGGAALAAVLVLGVAVGRWTAPPAPQSTAVTETTGPTLAERRASGYREATSQLFGRAEMRLAGFQAQPAPDESAAATADWATGLLTQTRLLLDSPAADDPDARRLLRELELVLAQIAALPERGGAGEASRIADGLHERATLQRLRVAGAL